MKNGETRIEFKRGVDDVIIIAYPADGGVGIKTFKDGVGDKVHFGRCDFVLRKH